MPPVLSMPGAVGSPAVHSSISITGDIYGHTTDDTARKAIDGAEPGTQTVNTFSTRVALSTALHTPAGYKGRQSRISPKPPLNCYFSGRADRI